MLPPLRQPNDHFSKFEANLEDNVELAYNEFSSTLRSQFDIIRFSSLDSDKKDLLRRLIVFPKKFFNRPADFRHVPETQRGDKVAKTYVEISVELITLCSNDEEQDEADELLLDLQSLPTRRFMDKKRQQMTLAAIGRRSQAISEAYIDMEVSPTKRLVPSTEGVMLPAVNVAIALGFDLPTLRCIMPGSAAQSANLAEHSRQDDTIGRGPLHIAVERSRWDLVRHFVHDRAGLEDRDGMNMTPLLLSALVGNLPVFQLLLQAGANLKATDRYYRDAMFIACESGNLDIASFLLKQKKTGVNDDYGLQDCSLLYAAASRGHSALVPLLLNFGADASRRVGGKLPHETAREQGHELISLLLEQAATRDASGPPSHASHRSHEQTPQAQGPRAGTGWESDETYPFLEDGSLVHMSQLSNHIDSTSTGTSTDYG